MIKRKLNSGEIFLIIANLLPVYGVWFQNWSFTHIFLVYCMETIIIGFFTIIKMGIISFSGQTKPWEANQGLKPYHGLFLILFFLIHYGMFVMIQTTMFLKIAMPGSNISLINLITDPGKHLGQDGILLLSAFVFGYGYENLSVFVLKNEYRTKSVSRIMIEPYPRIFIQQFTVIIGAFFLMLGSGKIFMLVFAAVKTWFTVFVDYEKVFKKANLKSVSQESKSSHS